MPTEAPAKPAVTIEKVQDVCRRSLYYLCTSILGYKDWDMVHDDLEKVLLRKARRKMILVPRGHLKSAIITKAYCIQALLKNPNVRILIANQVWDKAREMLFEIKEYLTTKSLLPKIFGSFESGRWTADDIVIRQRTQALSAASIATTGVEAETTSSHYDLIILDDIQGLQNFQTPEQREKVKRFYRSMIDLLEQDGDMIVVGTRWHLDDVYQHILDTEKQYFLTHVRKVVEDGKIPFAKKFSKRFNPITKTFDPTPAGEYCMDFINYLKASKGSEFYCTPAETPILMADWRTKPIEFVKVGDEIVGFTLGQGKVNGSLVKTRVKRTFSKQDHVLKFVMKSGRTVLCTKDHRWYTGRFDQDANGHNPYAPAQIGSKLQFVCPVEQKLLSEAEKLDWAYLAGLFDGEGTTKSGGTLAIAQCESKNPEVFREMQGVMSRLGISYGSFVRDASLAKHGRKHSPGNTIFWMRDTFNVSLNFIRNSPCAKAGQMAERFFKFGKKFVREQDEVVDVKYESYGTVYALETETGNYIAWGYASSNSQYMNDPIDEENQLFKKSYFRYWLTKPEGLHVCMTVDLAIGQKQENDYTAILVCGKDKSHNIYVLDCIRGHWRPSDVVDNIFQMREKWSPHVVGMEVNGFQRTMQYGVEEEMRKRKNHFPITEIKNQINSKEFRIKALEPYYRNNAESNRDSGKIYHAEWMKEKDLEHELLAFPKAKHDDLSDSLSMTLNLLSPGISNQRKQMQPGTWEYVEQMAHMNSKPYRGFFNYGG
jgi:predicted phage terminase large subunit-like protein